MDLSKNLETLANSFYSNFNMNLNLPIEEQRSWDSLDVSALEASFSACFSENCFKAFMMKKFIETYNEMIMNTTDQLLVKELLEMKERVKNSTDAKRFNIDFGVLE
jgi:hypothetical protein